jgi:hypothetical protein
LGSDFNCKVADSLNSKAVINGKVYVIMKEDTLFVKPIVQGYFSISCNELLKPQIFLLIESETHEKKKVAMNASSCGSDSLHIIKLFPRAKLLENIILESKTPIIRQDFDKITYNVQQDPESRSISLMEMMRKMPFISVTADDVPMLKGNTNFLVLLDGKRSSLFSSNNLREALRAIPASNILQIEIITDPPPRYESEGFSGIVNIITLKRLDDGYNGSVNLNAASFISSGSSSFNLRKNKFGLTFFGGVNYERTPFNTFHSETGASGFSIIQDGKSKVLSNTKYTSTMISYEIDSLNLVTLNLGFVASRSTYQTITDAATHYSGGFNSSYYSFQFNQENIGRDWDANINYQKSFKKSKSRILTASYRYNENRGKNVANNFITRRQDFEGDPDYLQKSKDGLAESAFQIDYVHPIKKIQIEAGARYIQRDIFSNFATSFYKSAIVGSVIDSSNTDNLEYNVSILGIYNSYLVRLKRFSVRTGFRYETTSLSGGFNILYSKINQQYNNLLPSLRVQYQVKNKAVYNIAFSQRIQRPGIRLLSPLIVKTAPGFERSGNPNLKPVLANVFSFGYSKFSKSSIAISLNYSFSKNTIQSYTTTIEADSIVLSSYHNIGRYERIGMDVNTRFQIAPKLDFSIEGSISRVLVKNNTQGNRLANVGIEGFIYSYLNYQSKNGLRYTANAGFYGPTINIQASSNSYFYSSLGVSKQVFKNKGNLSFRIVSPFQRYRIIRTRILTDDFYQDIERRNAFKAFYLGFYFKFGKLSKEVKRNKRSIQIDDSASETGKVE